MKYVISTICLLGVLVYGLKTIALVAKPKFLLKYPLFRNTSNRELIGANLLLVMLFLQLFFRQWENN